uniref:Drf_GBD domain-containing protein n=2 Tax=Macrostomum lignano TaxID=282301 RepID=A0A1I8G9R3_9PLAT
MSQRMVVDDSPARLLDGLAASLRSQPISFVRAFLDGGGLDALAEVLAIDSYDDAIAVSLLRCLYCAMNSQLGRDAVSEHPSLADSLLGALVTKVNSHAK